MQTPTHSFRYLLTALASLIGLLGVASAHAQTVITSLPCTITASGTYVLNQNLSVAQTSGVLIQINASNVTIDFRNHYISGPTNAPNQINVGIRATERSNLTIKNGTIAYCRVGISLAGDGSATTNSVNHQIDHMRVTYCSYLGISVDRGPGSRITNCQVSQTGSVNGVAYGIDAEGTGVMVRDNVVSTVSGSPSYGVYADTGCFVRRNTVSNAVNGLYGGKYQDNLTAGCTTAYSHGIDAGGNN